MSRPGSAALILLLAALLQLPTAPARANDSGWSVDWGLEVKAHYRDSDANRFRSPFPFPPTFLPVGETQGFLETVEAGSHAEVSVVTLDFDAAFEELFAARIKVDVIDRYDRNPTSDDREVDVDEVWLRFGRETPPARLAPGWGGYVKAGKFGHFERQNDRHLESYGLVSTAFNRFEDAGVEIGVDLGRFFYLKGSVTQGNPVFIRDPNALAGDNGNDFFFEQVNPDPELKSGIVILYDAEVEDLAFDEDELEIGWGVGARFEDAAGRFGADVLVWGYRRDLAQTVELHGTRYGGDLDLLRGPGNGTPLPITDDDKEEVGANLWLYWNGLSLFAQVVDQELAGMPRDGFEAELAWNVDLPLRWTVGGHQLFTSVAPAVRYSKLDPDFAGGDRRFPAVSVRWEWEKIDYGLRLGLYRGLDLTVEYADHTFILGTGAEADNDELLATVRWRH